MQENEAQLNASMKICLRLHGQVGGMQSSMCCSAKCKSCGADDATPECAAETIKVRDPTIWDYPPTRWP